MTIYVNPSATCDGCGHSPGGVIYDAKSKYGPWGNFCQECFDDYCIGLGLGKGQKYELNEAGKYELTEGGSTTNT